MLRVVRERVRNRPLPLSLSLSISLALHGVKLHAISIYGLVY